MTRRRPATQAFDYPDRAETNAIPRLDRAEKSLAPGLDRLHIADWLDRLAVETSDLRYRNAAGALRAKEGRGRRPINDALALDEIRLLVLEGHSAEEAARSVAIARPHSQSLLAETKRLARKYRANKIGAIK